MKKILLRSFIACLLVLTVVLAVTRPPQSYYPIIEIDAIDPSGTLTLRFLLDGRSTLTECESLTGSLTRVVLKSCPQCRVKALSCETTLSEPDHNLFTANPLAIPSGRMANGIVTYHADNPELALAACQVTQAQSRKTSSPVICHPAKASRTKPAGPSPINLWAGALLLVALASSWLVGWLIIRYEHLHAHLSHDHVGSGPQKYHTEPTPRIGGIAVLAGLLSAGGVMLFTDAIQTERAFGLLLLASVPAFLGGLVEDITKKVGVLERLLLTMLSGAVAAFLLGAVLDRLDIPGVDQALRWLPLAVVFTAFAVGGIANAINIIDGYNGLAGGYAVIVLAAMAFVANSAGDGLVFAASLALAGAILGFLVWNWPGGKIFLGDGGAYLVGFILAELSVLLVMRNPGVSPWFPLLLLIYPVFETIFSIYRKKFLRGHSPGHPDGLHFHMLIYKRLVRIHVGSNNPRNKLRRNSSVARYIWAATSGCALVGIAFWGNTQILKLAALGYCIFYVLSYRQIVKWRVPVSLIYR